MNSESQRIVNNINEYAEHLRTHGAPDIALKLNELTGGPTKKWDDRFIKELVKQGTEAYDRELAARGSRPRVVGVIISTIDCLSHHECQWEALDLEDLATDIEEKEGKPFHEIPQR